MSKHWVWDLDIEGMVERYCTIETTDGVMREGKITGLQYRDFKLKDGLVDHQLQIPMSVELNGDPSDTIEFQRIFKMELR